jgi:hypothetical protein
MEEIHAHRDQTTRDFHNKIDSHRQRDSGLKGMIRSMGDPEKNAHRWRQEMNALPLPPALKEVGNAGLLGVEAGAKLGKWLAK